MADQGKWFKLWESALDDQDLENLTIHEWFSWARFGTYLKKHGKHGKIRLRAPATAIVNLLRVPTFQDAIAMIKRFPNYTLNESQNETANVTVESVTCSIACQNWLKYQGDFSTERVRKHRSRETANVTVQEETRGEETKSPSPKGSSPSRTARSAPPDAPATRASAVVENDPRQEHTHGGFLAIGFQDSNEPQNSFGWTHLEMNLSREERIQSKWRERYYKAPETVAIETANAHQEKVTPPGGQE